MKNYMAKLGDFKFCISQVEYNSLKRSFNFSFNKSDCLKEYPKYHSSGMWEENILLSGEALIKKLEEINPLLDMAKKKEPILFVTGYGEIFGKVIILSIDLDQSFFITDGMFLKQEFSLKMVRYR